MNKTFLQLGSNIGNSIDQLQIAIDDIEKNIGNVVQKSSLYTTAAWGNKDQPDFVNQVLLVETILPANKLLKVALDIEKKMGRIRSFKNAARIIDIDILFFNKEIIQDVGLTIPHPEIANRRFVLIPLAEIAPNFIHPTSNLTIKKMLKICTDDLNVQKI
jgi:2-amino-4-hydroxy-6-hydroxymethyldihydropteridine diphosphokinase